MIIGDDHPSTIRLHQQNLQQCDHAVVSVGGSAWLVNLHPSLKTDQEVKLVSRLNSTTHPIKVGNVSIRLGRAVPKRNTRLQLPTNLAAASNSAASHPNAQPVVSQDAAFISPNQSLTKADLVERTDGYDTLTPEVLTSDVTDRLVTIDNAKFGWARGVKFYFSTALFCVGLLIVGWIFVQFVLPWILLENTE